jgi:hypothetical protein
VSPADAVVHDCPPASEQLSGDAAYIFGSATPERTVDLPTGVAFHLAPQQRLILEQHVINATPDVIQGGVTFEISKPAADVPIEHHADIIWFADWSFAIPPNQETVETSHCTVPYDVNVFGLMSYAHSQQLSRELEAELVTMSDDHRLSHSATPEGLASWVRRVAP